MLRCSAFRLPLLGLVLLLAVVGPACASDSVPDWVKTAMATPTPDLPADARAVVLLDETVFTVAADGKAVEHRRHVVKILRPAGRDDAIAFLPFDKDSKVLSFHVWSVSPTGQEYSVKDKDVLEIGYPGSGNFYDDMRVKVVEAPGRDPGGYVAFESEQRQPPYRAEADWFFQDDMPRLHQSFQLELPPGYSYAASWAHHDVLPPRDLEHGKTLWALDSTPSIDRDRVPLAPGMKGLMGRLSIHYGPANQTPALGTWQEVGNWYDNLARDRMVATPDIMAKATELTAGKTDFYDRAEAIAEFVQKDIRYFVIEKGVGGLQPHPASEIFHNRYGDCKDKSTLMAAMFSSVGLHSIMVLVDTTRGFVDPAAPSSLGNHAIAAIEIPVGYNSPKLRSVVTAKDGKRYLIADPTSEKTAFGQLEADLQGGYGVLVEGPQSEVVQFPVLPPQANTVQREAKLELTSDGVLTGDVTERRFGDRSEYVRHLYGDEDQQAQTKYMNRRLGQDFTTFNVSDLKVADVKALNKPVTSTYKLSAERYSRSMGPLLMVRPRVLGLEGFALDRKHRTLPIDLNSTTETRDDYVIKLPEGLVVDELPEPVKVDVGFASYESATHMEGTSLHYTRTYTVREISIPASRYADLQKLESAIDADEQNAAVFKKK